MAMPCADCPHPYRQHVDWIKVRYWAERSEKDPTLHPMIEFACRGCHFGFRIAA